MSKEELKKYEKKPGLWFFPEDFTDESGYDDISDFDFEEFVEKNFDWPKNFEYESSWDGGHFVFDRNRIEYDLEYMKEDGGLEYFQEVCIFNEDCFK